MNRRKLLSLLLASGMVISLLPAPAIAAMDDAKGHWAESSIARWNAVKVLNGDQNGNFNPNKEMTRAEFAVMLANMMGYTEKGTETFSDVPADAWYADAIYKLMAAGVMKGYDGKANPLAPISREQVAVMLCRAMNVNTEELPQNSDGIVFADGAEVSDWAKNAVAALAARGMIAGVGGNRFAPGLQINRASVAKLLDNMVVTYVTENNTVLTGQQEGIVIVAAQNVTIKDAQLKENLIITPAASGETKLENVTAGDVILSAEGGTLTTDKTTVLEDLTVTAPKAAVSISGKAGSITADQKAQGATVEVAKGAQAETVTAAAPDTQLAVSGKVNQVTVEKSAQDTKLEVAAGAKVDKLDTAADRVTVGGKGTVKDMNVTDGENVSVEKGTTVDKVNNQTETPVKVGNQTVKPGTEAKPSKPSGGGSYRPQPQPVAKTVEAGTAEELNTLLATAGRWDDLTVTVTTKIAEGDILAENFQGAGLTLDFGSTGSTLTSLSINAPNATKVLLKDEATGSAVSGALTLDAPSAATADCALDVTGDAGIKVAGNGTFTAQGTLGGTVKMLQGVLKMTEGGSVTVPQEAAGPVSLDVAAQAVNIDTTQPITMISAGKVNIKAANAKVEIMEGKTLAEEVEIAGTADGAVLTGAGAVQKVTVKASATVSCTAAYNGSGDDPCVTVPSGAAENLELTLNMSAPRISFPVDIQKAGVTVNDLRNTADIKVNTDSITVTGTVNVLTLKQLCTADVSGTVNQVKVETTATDSVVQGSGSANSFRADADCTVGLPVEELTLGKFTGENSPSTVTIQKNVGTVNFVENVETATLTLDNVSIGSIVSGVGVSYPINTLTLSGSGKVANVESYKEENAKLTVTINEGITVERVFKVGAGTVEFNGTSQNTPTVNTIQKIELSNTDGRRYTVGDNTAFIGIVITPYYGVDETHVACGTPVTVTKANVNDYISDLPTTKGTQTVTVTYLGKTKTFEINVELNMDQLNADIQAAKDRLAQLSAEGYVAAASKDQVYSDKKWIDITAWNALKNAIPKPETIAAYTTKAEIDTAHGALATANTGLNNAVIRAEDGTLKTDTEVLDDAVDSLTARVNGLGASLTEESNLVPLSTDILVEKNTTNDKGAHTVTVTWESSNLDAITVDADGKTLTVTQGDAEQEVTLTATVSFTRGAEHKAMDTKTFTATVAGTTPPPEAGNA